MNLEVLWRDETEIAIRDRDSVRRFSYVRRGTELLLTDGYGYWTIVLDRRGGAQPPPDQSSQHSGGRQGGPPTSGRITSQMPGKVLDVRVAQSDSVSAGQVLLVLEAMKMEHAITAPFAGTVAHLTLTPGERVMPGDQLAEIEPLP